LIDGGRKESAHKDLITNNAVSSLENISLLKSTIDKRARRNKQEIASICLLE